MSEHRKGIRMSDVSPEWRTRLTKGTVAIVIAYVANNRVPRFELPTLIALVAQSLTAAAESSKQRAASAIRKPSKDEIRASIQQDRLISFVDGKPYKALRRHLRFKGYTPKSYRIAYGLPVDYPMVAPTYSERRSEISKEIGVKQRQLATRRMLH